MLLDDFQNNPFKVAKTPQVCLDFLHKNGHRVVSYDDWLLLDKEEKRLGQVLGKVRKKFDSVNEMILYLEAQDSVKG